MGHPQFAGLRLGESAHTEAVAMFLDLRGFTARSFWGPTAEVVRLNTAVVAAVASAVQLHGGYVLGLRGDGVFASFDNENPAIAAGVAAAVGGFAIEAVRGDLNAWLTRQGMDPVQIRVGADYGRLDFVRMGTDAASDINVVGFAANFAAKCEKWAHSWEFVAGEGFLDLLPADHWRPHEESPRVYSRGTQRSTYSVGLVSTARYASLLDGVARQLDGHDLAAVGVI
jgi:class 3 adenylate cyclase